MAESDSLMAEIKTSDLLIKENKSKPCEPHTTLSARAIIDLPPCQLKWKLQEGGSLLNHKKRIMRLSGIQSRVSLPCVMWYYA